MNQMDGTNSYTEVRVFKRLLHSLPDEYSTVVDILESKHIDEENLDDRLIRLLEKEAELGGKVDKGSHYSDDRREKGKSKKPHAKNGHKNNQNRGGRSGTIPKGKTGNHNKKYNRKRRDNSSDNDQKGRCFICDKDNHYAKDCKELQAFRRFKKWMSSENKDRNHNGQDNSDNHGHWSHIQNEVDSLHEPNNGEEVLMAQGPPPQDYTTKGTYLVPITLLSLQRYRGSTRSHKGLRTFRCADR